MFCVRFCALEGSLCCQNLSVEMDFQNCFVCFRLVVRYTQNGTITSIHCVNAPYLFPIEWFKGDNLIVYGPEGEAPNLAVFYSREWRGTKETTGTKQYTRSVSNMAQEINGYAKGTVQSLYMTYHFQLICFEIRNNI